jgi:hypothetical protein
MSIMKEKELCIALGISRDILKEMRTFFEEGKCWKKIPSLKPENLWQIEWTPEGILLLREHIGLKPTDAVEPPQKVSGTVSAKHRNPRVISVLINGKEESVLCRDSSKFGIGMPADVRWDGARWVVVRHPRFNGKY